MRIVRKALAVLGKRVEASLPCLMAANPFVNRQGWWESFLGSFF